MKTITKLPKSLAERLALFNEGYVIQTSHSPECYYYGFDDPMMGVILYHDLMKWLTENSSTWYDYENSTNHIRCCFESSNGCALHIMVSSSYFQYKINRYVQEHPLAIHIKNVWN